MVVVDRDRAVRVWSQRSCDLWRLREDEVRGVDLVELDVGLPVKKLADALDECIAHNTQPDDVIVEAVTRRGRTVECRVAISPLLEQGTVSGAILVMDVR